MVPIQIFANNEAGVQDATDLNTLYRHFTIEVRRAIGPAVFDVALEGSVAGSTWETLIQTDAEGIFSTEAGHLIRYVRVNLITWDTSPNPSNSAVLYVDLAAGE